MNARTPNHKEIGSDQSTRTKKSTKAMAIDHTKPLFIYIDPTHDIKSPHSLIDCATYFANLNNLK